MVTVSAIPGRLRFQCDDLTGSQRFCRHVENRLARLSPVIEARANHRTGRLLVLYDAQGTDPERLATEIRRAIQAQKQAGPLRGPSSDGPVRRGRREMSHQDTAFGDFARQAAILGVASLLPAPWSALLPMTAQFIQRDG